MILLNAYCSSSLALVELPGWGLKEVHQREVYYDENLAQSKEDPDAQCADAQERGFGTAASIQQHLEDEIAPRAYHYPRETVSRAVLEC